MYAVLVFLYIVVVLFYTLYSMASRIYSRANASAPMIAKPQSQPCDTCLPAPLVAEVDVSVAFEVLVACVPVAVAETAEALVADEVE